MFTTTPTGNNFQPGTRYSLEGLRERRAEIPLAYAILPLQLPSLVLYDANVPHSFFFFCCWGEAFRASTLIYTLWVNSEIIIGRSGLVDGHTVLLRVGDIYVVGVTGAPYVGLRLCLGVFFCLLLIIDWWPNVGGLNDVAVRLGEFVF